jgi:hypothetical protein
MMGAASLGSHFVAFSELVGAGRVAKKAFAPVVFGEKYGAAEGVRAGVVLYSFGCGTGRETLALGYGEHPARPVSIVYPGKAALKPPQLDNRPILFHSLKK